MADDRNEAATIDLHPRNAAAITSAFDRLPTATRSREA
jgi:hypothetical protein